MSEISGGEEVKDVAKFRRARLVDLRILAARAGDGREFFVLHIEDLGQRATGRLEDIGLELDIIALRALPLFVPNRFSPSRHRSVSE